MFPTLQYERLKLKKKFFFFEDSSEKYARRVSRRSLSICFTHNKPETARFNKGRAAGYCIGDEGCGKPRVNRVSGRCSNGDIFRGTDLICFSYRGGIPSCIMSLA